MFLAADNLQITDPKVARAVELMDPGPIRDLVKRCVKSGADAVDINPGPLKKDPGQKMKFLVETVQSVTDLPLLLDTTNPDALAAGLAASSNPVIINGFSLEPARIERILPLAVEFDADIIGYLLSPDSRVPVDEAGCFEIASELLVCAEKSGLNPERLIIDPVVAPLVWENGARHNRDILSVIRNLGELYGFPVRTIAGLSNLTSGPAPYAARLTMETAFLAMMADAGLSIALLNIFHTQTVACARACNILLTSDIFAWEELARFCDQSVFGPTHKPDKAG